MNAFDNTSAAADQAGSDPHRGALISKCYRWLVLIVSAVGTLALVGWELDVVVLKSIFSGWANMQPNTAVCFVFAGAILSLSNPSASECRNATRWIARTLAAAVGLLALLILYQYAFSFELGIDQWLFTDTGASLHPGQMPMATAANFVLVSVALLLLVLFVHF